MAKKPAPSRAKPAPKKAAAKKTAGRSTRIGGVTIDLAPAPKPTKKTRAIRKAVRAFYAARGA